MDSLAVSGVLTTIRLASQMLFLSLMKLGCPLLEECLWMCQWVHFITNRTYITTAVFESNDVGMFR